MCRWVSDFYGIMCMISNLNYYLYRESASCTHVSGLLHALVAMSPSENPIPASTSSSIQARKKLYLLHLLLVAGRLPARERRIMPEFLTLFLKSMYMDVRSSIISSL